MLYNGLYNVEEVELPEIVKRKGDISEKEYSSQSGVCDFMNDTAVLCDKIRYMGQMYQNDDIVVLETSSRISLKVGLVRGIIFKDASVAQKSNRR